MAALHGLWDVILRTNNAEDIQGYIAKGGALTASIEAIGACPGSSPRTIEHGLWAEPTVLDNVETFANVPRIIRGGRSGTAAPAPRPLP